MNRSIARGLTVVLLFVGQVVAASAAGIPWSPDWQSAQATAKNSNKPVMIDFYTDWCGWCKKLDADVYPDAKVVQAAGQFVPVKLDAEKEGKTLATKYSVSGFPTILFLDLDGTVVGKIVGYAPAPDFTTSLNQVAKDYHDFPALQAHVKANPQDTAAGTKLTLILAQRGRLDDAVTQVKSMEAVGKDLGPALIPSYNAIADAYNDQRDPTKASAWYHKVLAVSKDPAILSQTRVQIAICDLNLKNWTDAQAQANALSNAKDASDKDKAVAKRILDYIDQHKGK